MGISILMSTLNDATNEGDVEYNCPASIKSIKLAHSKYPYSKDEEIKTVKGDVNA